MYDRIMFTVSFTMHYEFDHVSVLQMLTFLAPSIKHSAIN
jgi:hypothetical protein